jgi:hypothetical protein
MYKVGHSSVFFAGKCFWILPLLVACLLAAVPACGGNVVRQAPSGEGAVGTNDTDARTADSGAVDSGSDLAVNGCETPSFVNVDGGDSLWTAPEPQDGEACPSLDAKWCTTCKICDCTASGWRCRFWTCE